MRIKKFYLLYLTIYDYYLFNIMSDDLDYGYIYCFSNPSMPDLLKCGMTTKFPTERLSNANSPDTFKPPTPYKIEFAKKVHNPYEKENLIHRLLEKYNIRNGMNKEFFKISVDKVRNVFDLIDGEYVDLTKNNEKCEKQKKIIKNIININNININCDKTNGKIRCELCKVDIISQYFIRHCKSISHVEREERKFRCERCNSTYKNIKSYKTHMNEYHKKKKRIKNIINDETDEINLEVDDLEIENQVKDVEENEESCESDESDESDESVESVESVESGEESNLDDN